MGNAEDWAANMRQELEQKDAIALRQVQRVELNRAIVAEQMPLAWEEIIKEFRTHCEALNRQLKPQRELHTHILTNNQFEIKPDCAGEIVRGKLEAQSIKITNADGTERYVPRPLMHGIGTVELESLEGRRTSTPSEIVRAALMPWITNQSKN